MSTVEQQRLQTIRDDMLGWRHWGPYVGDRAWATVREDYSTSGDAWGYLSHDLARSKAYRWGEDGIAGISDRYQLLCFAPAFWNTKDPILKERLFGLTPHEGNHGEDVKEYYFHIDNTPTHSYMKLLYKYPQRAFPYAWLVEENKRRNGQGFEFELLDTGIFDDDRYFDIFIEYAKIDTQDLVIKIEAFNRGPEAAPLHILPHLWFRKTWAWGPVAEPEPVIRSGAAGAGWGSLEAWHPGTDIMPDLPDNYFLGTRYLYAPAGGDLLFTDNETNAPRVFGPTATSRKPYVKDAFHRHIVNGEPGCVNPAGAGTKAALHYRLNAVRAKGSVKVVLRLSDKGNLNNPLAEAEDVLAQRAKEADEFYAAIHPKNATEDEKRVQRQALAGLLWTKQNYFFNVQLWLDGDDPRSPPPASREHIRNGNWRHLNSMRVMIPAEKWEYPWFAAWDLAFTCPAIALVDGQLAKDQLYLLLFEQFQHPNGQVPAYEWEFSDLNPPVHAWAVWRVYNMDRIRSGRADREFLEKCFHKMLINFAWWVNRTDAQDNNVFEGGFLGMDNITVIDRSLKCSDGAVLEQSDASGYMGMFCLHMMRIALELAKENPVYESLAIKFFQHYALIANAMKHMGERDHQLWDEKDGFFYDVLRHPDGRYRRFRVRSWVGLIPLFAVERLEVGWIAPFKHFTQAFNWALKHRAHMIREVVHKVEDGGKVTYALTILNAGQLRRLIQRLGSSDEFLSDHGIRSLSKAHLREPFEFDGRVVGYEPAESDNKIKGGNSNWRGPIWFPTSFLLIESLRKLGKAFGPRFRVRCEAEGGKELTFPELARDIARRMVGIFLRDESGRRPVYGGSRKFQEDPHWRDHLLFYEYFHGDNGAGLGASHQTGWTGLVASLIDEWCAK